MLCAALALLAWNGRGGFPVLASTDSKREVLDDLLKQEHQRPSGAGRRWRRERADTEGADPGDDRGRVHAGVHYLANDYGGEVGSPASIIRGGGSVGPKRPVGEEAPRQAVHEALREGGVRTPTPPSRRYAIPTRMTPRRTRCGRRTATTTSIPRTSSGSSRDATGTRPRLC